MQENQNKYPLPNSKLLILYALIEYACFVVNRAQTFKARNNKGYATTFTFIRKLESLDNCTKITVELRNSCNFNVF